MESPTVHTVNTPCTSHNCGCTSSLSCNDPRFWMPAGFASTGHMTSSSVEDDYSYDYSIQPAPSMPPLSLCTDAACIIMAIIYIAIFVLGVTGNGLVIWVAGFKMKRSINTIWYLSLAVSDFMFCAFLPFNVDYLVRNDWIFGLHMCKFMSFIMFLNMFGSIFLLLIISLDRCLVVTRPVWAQNHRSVTKSLAVVVVAWVVSAALSIPSVVYRDISTSWKTKTTICFTNYLEQQHHHHVTVVTCRFLFGFFIPFVVILACYVLIVCKMTKSNMAKSRKPFKIMTVLITTFFICWLPYHIFTLMELEQHKYRDSLPVGMRFSVALASANSCLNPFLYAFMGKHFKRNCFAILSNIEEEERSTVRGTSNTQSDDV